MGFINVAERTINAKLVYYGVGVGGKTTSLQQVHGIFCPRNEVQLVSINTEEESTLLFDFLPINLGKVGGFKIRIQGFTVPGQPKYKRMRKYVLQGADAVVFVVDSQRSRLEENVESLRSLQEHLREQSNTADDIPIVVQYNKRDLDDLLSEEELDEHFRFRDDVVAFPSVATEGQGVFEAFVEAAVTLVERKVALYGLAESESAPHVVAESVRDKLWRICDEVRRGREVVPVDKLPHTRVELSDSPSGPAKLPSSETPSNPATREDDFDLDYELRDSVSAANPADAGSGERSNNDVLSDEELDRDLSAGLVVLESEVAAETEPDLLDKTVQSNLELARRFGDLDEQRVLLERKVTELVDIAQCTVHDLNRPLSAMHLMLSTLAKGYLGELSEQVQQAIDNGLLAVHQMEHLVRDLLDSSRLDHDGMDMEFVETDLTMLVADVLRLLRYELEEHRVLIRVEPLPTVNVDCWALTKVMMNLLGNSIAYRAVDRIPMVRIYAEEHDEYWALAVADNGIGVPDQDCERLFRRFERGSNTGGISGNGLGLHIIKEIVQGHGGRVLLESEVDVGTTFWLHLPKKPVMPPHSVVSETAARADL